ncbi:hypothetical protein PMAYCL1PPCAC_29979, partial [Pristionchus mayeri]
LYNWSKLTQLHFIQWLVSLSSFCASSPFPPLSSSAALAAEVDALLLLLPVVVDAEVVDSRSPPSSISLVSEVDALLLLAEADALPLLLLLLLAVVAAEVDTPSPSLSTPSPRLTPPPPATPLLSLLTALPRPEDTLSPPENNGSPTRITVTLPLTYCQRCF